jgi:hypothetical protein
MKNEKVQLPKKCELAYNIKSNCLYLQFFSQAEADEFHAALPEKLQEAFIKTLNATFFIRCDQVHPDDVFELPENGIKAFLFQNHNALAPIAVINELAEKGWRYRNQKGHDFVLSAEGYRDYWLDYNEESGVWRLKQFANPMALAEYERLGEREIESIFRLCSFHAKFKTQ